MSIDVNRLIAALGCSLLLSLLTALLLVVSFELQGSLSLRRSKIGCQGLTLDCLPFNN